MKRGGGSSSEDALVVGFHLSSSVCRYFPCALQGVFFFLVGHIFAVAPAFFSCLRTLYDGGGCFIYKTG
jgi:hypothetical protein